MNDVHAPLSQGLYVEEELKFACLSRSWILLLTGAGQQCCLRIKLASEQPVRRGFWEEFFLPHLVPGLTSVYSQQPAETVFPPDLSADIAL